MPYTIKRGGGKKKWKILNDKGRVVGSSTSKADAEASIRARLAGEHGWKPKNK